MTPAGDRLHPHTSIADDSKSDSVAFGVNTPMLECEHSKHPVAAAEAGNADSLAFQIRRGFDVAADSEGTHKSIDERRDENAIETVQHSPQARARGGAIVKLRIARR